MLSIIRGDTKYYKFKRVDKCNDCVIVTKPDKMYFTVKFDYNVDEVLIQKKLDDDIQFDEETSYYYLQINPSDTNKLPYGRYVYDIEITEGPKVTTIAIGEIELTEEVTFYSNKDDGVSDETIIVEEDEVEEIITIEEYATGINGNFATTEYVDEKIQNLVNNDIQTLSDLEDENRKNIEINKNNIESLKSKIPDALATRQYVDESIQDVVIGDIANLTELITENQDNIKQLQKDDITIFNTGKPSADGLITINATTKNNQNIQAFSIYNGLDAKYPYAAAGTQIIKDLNDRIKALEEKIQQLETANISSKSNNEW